MYGEGGSHSSDNVPINGMYYNRTLVGKGQSMMNDDGLPKMFRAEAVFPQRISLIDVRLVPKEVRPEAYTSG